MSMIEKLGSVVSLSIRTLEDEWFDRTRGVRTGPDPVPRRATDTIGPVRDGHMYLPARARNVRSAIAALPITSPQDYTFVDVGSGKGRVVFIAAELPFKRVIGLEYSAGLHAQALGNLEGLRRRRSKSAEILFVHADAASYTFPPGNLVLHLFNPFGPEVMGCMLRNLAASLRDEPRHVVVIMLWPELSGMVEGVQGMRLFRRTRRFDVFQTDPSGQLGGPLAG